ncbi:MAG: hypothetical protein AAFX39_00240 [Pseudomonadota bacterium]
MDAQEDRQFAAGSYVVSAEAPHATIMAVTGTGSSEDPLIVHQIVHDGGASTLTVRFYDPRFLRPATATEGNFLKLAMTLVIRNASGRAWVGFDVELQQESRLPSVYEDGLSFDQMRVLRRREIGSDSFVEAVRALEPYDEIRFLDGFVDPGQSARFDINIIDVTPNGVFHLKQIPRLPAS